MFMIAIDATVVNLALLRRPAFDLGGFLFLIEQT
jgi:hypothetical protein